MKRSLRLILAAPLAAAALLLATVVPAQASAADTGTYPNQGNYCIGGSYANPIASRIIEDDYGRQVGRVDVRYSYKCQTNWLTITGNPTGGGVLTYLWSDAGGGVMTEYDTNTTMSTYTKQVYAPGSTCIHFQTHMYTPSGQSYGETYSAGANYQTIC